MSQNPDPREAWREMLESMLGPEGAAEALDALEANGVDLSQLAASGILDNPAQVQAAMAQMQQVLSADDDGRTRWRFAHDVARQVAHTGGDPMVTAAAATKTRSVLSTADLWLDVATDLPPAPGAVRAASRAEWVEATLPTLRIVAEPVGASVAAALSKTLGEQIGGQAEALGGLGPAGLPLGGMDLSTMMTGLGELSFAMQVGQAAGTLAREVFGATDTGLPLLPEGRMLVPANVTEFARGIEIDLALLEESLRDIDPTNVDQLRDALSGGIFAQHRTESQDRALGRLETALALVEGWVEEVSAQAVAPHLPHAVPLREMLRRRRAAGGPAEDTFRTLVGLELRPRRAREAARLWQLLAADRGMSGRDQMWSQLDLMPTGADLDDPETFVRGGVAEEFSGDLDAELAKILGRHPSGPAEPESLEADSAAEPETPADPDSPDSPGSPDER